MAGLLLGSFSKVLAEAEEGPADDDNNEDDDDEEEEDEEEDEKKNPDSTASPFRDVLCFVVRHHHSCCSFPRVETAHDSPICTSQSQTA